MLAHQMVKILQWLVKQKVIKVDLKPGDMLVYRGCRIRTLERKIQRQRMHTSFSAL